MKSIKSEDGFTIIEFILVIVLIAILIPLGANIMSDSFELFKGGLNRMNTGQRAEIALNEIAQYLRSVSTDPGDKTLGNDGDTLILKSYNSSGAIADITIKLNSSGEQLNLLLNNKIIAENVDQLTISNTNSSRYEITIEYRVNLENYDTPAINSKSIFVNAKNL